MPAPLAPAQRFVGSIRITDLQNGRGLKGLLKIESYSPAGAGSHRADPTKTHLNRSLESLEKEVLDLALKALAVKVPPSAGCGLGLVICSGGVPTGAFLSTLQTMSPSEHAHGSRGFCCAQHPSRQNK